MNDSLPSNAYPASLAEVPGGYLYMADLGGEDGLFFAGQDCPLPGGTETAPSLFRLPLDHGTARRLWELLPWTAPRQVLGAQRTFGAGDRLGIAADGQLRAIRDYDVFPVLAQQSLRELRLMGGTYESLLDRVTFQVLRAGYRGGYGADGDHLKTREDILNAIESGVTMITLDCSEHIHSDRAPSPLDSGLAERYLAGPIPMGDGVSISFTPQSLARAQAIYGEAIRFAGEIYRTCIQGQRVDLEISMDETEAPTTPEQHYFAASELLRAGVRFCTLAPRFCGEFQKGVDYIGDLEQFRREAAVHAAIAGHFGYKLSIHSGSDKFSVFPAIGELTGERFHLKTSGTSWLEALRLVSSADPVLFRAVWAYALTVFEECRAYYHVSTELTMLPDTGAMADGELPALLDQNAPRQLLHITYGKIMNHPDLAPRLRALWRERRDDYSSLLAEHLGRHLALLCPRHPRERG